MINRGEVSSLEVLADTLLLDHGDKDVSSDTIYSVIDVIDQGLSGEFVLTENEILEMNRFVETRLSHSFLNENLDGLKTLTRDLAEGRISDNRVVKDADNLIS